MGLDFFEPIASSLLPSLHMRICSLLPGATEVVAALGLADDLVGISHECDYPPEVKNTPVMIQAAIDAERSSSPDIDRQVRAALETGRHLYALDADRFARAQPDLVITQDLCHVCAITPDQLQHAIGALPKPPRLLSLNPTTLDQVLTDVERIGEATGRETRARTLAAELRDRLQSIRTRVAQVRERPKVVCLEWLAPLYAAGHWVPEMVAWAGGVDALGVAGAVSTQVTRDQVVAAGPEVLVLMPCGFTLNRTLRELERLPVDFSRPGWQTLPAVRTGRVFAVNASAYFSRPGPRLVDGVAMLAALCHPSVFGGAVPPEVRRVNLFEQDPMLRAR